MNMKCRECGREIQTNEANGVAGYIYCDECFNDLKKYFESEFEKFLHSFQEEYINFAEEIIRG